MLAWLSFKGLYDVAIRHSSQLSWFVFFVSWVPVLIAQIEIREKIRNAKGWRKRLRQLELCLLFMIPVIAFISTKASEGTSDIADQKISLLESRLGVATNRVAELEAKTGPRSIKPLQFEALVKCLSPGPRGPVMVQAHYFGPPKEEADAYAAQIVEVLKAAGFDLKPPSLAVFAMQKPGVLMFVKDVDHPPSHALSVQQCFVTNGILPMVAENFRSDWKCDSNTVIIWVSQKP